MVHKEEKHCLIQAIASPSGRHVSPINKQVSELNSPLVIGLTGGIASGKSAVASLFGELGANLLDADKLGHVVLEEECTKEAIVKHWGDKVVRDNRISRKDLAAIVFDPETGADQLEKLEAITHPRIRQLMIERLAEFRKEGTVAVILDAPLLFEADWDELCDKVLFVECDEEIRTRRALARGWSREEFKAREDSQLALNVKKQRSTQVINNSGGLEQTKMQIQELWQSWGLATNLH